MSNEDPTMLIWEKKWVGREPGTHYSANGSSALLRSDDTNDLVTHAVIGPAVEDGDEDEPDQPWSPVVLAAGIAVGVVATIAAVKFAPRLMRWAQDFRAQRSLPSEAEFVIPQADFSAEVEAVLQEQRTSMSSAEAQRRLIAVMVAAAFIADQMRALSNAQIENGLAPELESAMQRLTVPQLTDSVNRMLEADAAFLDADTSAELMRLFGGGRVVDGHYVPLRNERVKEALRLPRSEA